MAKEESLELKSTEEPKSNKKWFILAGAGILVVLLIGGGVWFFLGSSSEEVPVVATEGAAQTATPTPENVTTASYVPMPRPFLFNLPGQDRARLV
ncbi:MAG: flagellar basal body-associated protein FliL, partial [Shewanella sp.]